MSMIVKTSAEIRQDFLDFFKSKDHKIVQSAPVVPFDDPTLLFTNAGMNQFKDIFLGKGTRDYNRATDTQKCIRVSGKHNDLEEVGYDTYHHTLFEMLGNWSFGDYYKAEAIEWAWELLTEVWKLPKERLWVTVYRTDDEALELWKEKTDIDTTHILRFDEKDNFWEMGDTGPCGPCSEIHINLSDDLNAAHLVNADSPECIEIWNLVFIQYFREKDGTLHDLPAKHVDTGMGFERVCAVLQEKKSNYDTDVFTPYLNKLVELSGVKYEVEEHKIAMRVIADHIRALTFAIADGALPGNEGRGYVLRRILRRAARYGRKLNLTQPFMFKLVDTVATVMGEHFPEVKENRDNIVRVIKSEEESFNATLDRGMDLFAEVAETTKKAGSKTIDGENVFKLYDTFGFPVDLTALLAREADLEIDLEKFEVLMAEQKERARQSTKDKLSAAGLDKLDSLTIETNTEDPTQFVGYSETVTKAKVTGFKFSDGKYFVTTCRTPFYTESGGQVSDEGTITVNGKAFPVIKLLKLDNQIVHIFESENDLELKLDDEVYLEVEDYNRKAVKRNHSATHLLHKALRDILGTHVQQSGSYVGADRLRFDFTHFEKVNADELAKIEETVNKKIYAGIELQHHKDTPFDEAKDMGALMFFGDKYGDKVNVVQFGDYSIEFCGGTHVNNTAEIGGFKIISESSIASGVRRIEAVTGEGVIEYINEQKDQIVSANTKIKELQDEKKKLEKELAEMQLQEKLGGLDTILSSAEDLQGIAVYKGKVEAVNIDELKSMGDELRNKMKPGVGLLIAEINDKVSIVCVVSDEMIKEKKLAAGKIVGDIAKMLGGGGGGRPHMATAGAKDVSKIDEALDKVIEVIGKFL